MDRSLLDSCSFQYSHVWYLYLCMYTQRTFWIFVCVGLYYIVSYFYFYLYMSLHIRRKNEKTLVIFGCTSCFVSFLTSIIGLFQFAWFIAGNVWVYSIYGQVQFTDLTAQSTYCDRTTYLFSFWVITAGYIVMGLSIVLGICSACLACVCGVCCLKKKWFRNNKAGRLVIIESCVY